MTYNSLLVNPQQMNISAGDYTAFYNDLTLN